MVSELRKRRLTVRVLSEAESSGLTMFEVLELAVDRLIEEQQRRRFPLRNYLPPKESFEEWCRGCDVDLASDPLALD